MRRPEVFFFFPFFHFKQTNKAIAVAISLALELPMEKKEKSLNRNGVSQLLTYHATRVVVLEVQDDFVAL